MRNKRGESECSTGSPITAKLYLAGTGRLFITLDGLAFLSADRNRSPGEPREQLEEAGKGDVRPLGAVDEGLAFGDQPGNGKAHSDPVVARGIDACAPARSVSGINSSMAPIRSSSLKMPIRVGFTLTPRTSTSPPGTINAAATRKAADDGSPGM